MFLPLCAVVVLAAGAQDAPPWPPRTTDYELLVRDLYADQPQYAAQWPVEWHIRVLEGLTQDLERGALDLGHTLGAPYFAPEVELAWLGAEGPPSQVGPARQTTVKPAASARVTAEAARKGFVAYFADYHFVEQASLKIKLGNVVAEGVFDGQVLVELAGRVRAGWRLDRGWVDARFERRAGAWQITRFVARDFTRREAPAKFFADATSALLGAVPAETRAMLRSRSVSDRFYMLDFDPARGPDAAGGAGFDFQASNNHPGVSVVDLDGDHFDDLYVWDMQGPAVFLHNEGGRGFTDRTLEYGLGFSHVSAGVFADLNGDGTLDLVLGRWPSRSELYFGSGRSFVPAALNRYSILPASVSSIAVADVDRDGKLDVFFGTVAGRVHRALAALMMTLDRGQPLSPFAFGLPEVEYNQLLRVLPRAMEDRMAVRFDATMFRYGPPNALFMNAGGGVLVDRTADSGLESYRQTLSSTLADLDDNGYPDLVIGNDFAPAGLYLNDGRRFVDASEQTGVGSVFFGMGNSVEDFDNDGDLDLYLTAMASSAGARVMSRDEHFSARLQPHEKDARKLAARGNRLFRNEGKARFTELTAQKPWEPARFSNWAYSAQFIDADADGWQDIYSPNGFYTSPVPLDGPVRDL